MSTLVESRSPFSNFMPKETCSFNYFNSSTANSKILTDYNNNMSPKHSMTNNCMAYPSKGPSATIKIISPPQTVQQDSDTLCSLGPSEVATCLSAVINRHQKLDRSMSEPVERSQQSTGRSNSFTSGTICNSTNNISGSSRYKTELCRPYEEHGVCKYGDKCQFAHGVHELRGMVRHPKYKTELCRTYHSSGFCPYGPRCHFIHNSDERKRSKSYSPESSSGETSPEDIFPNQKMFFNDDVYQKPPSPPYNAATLSESFTFDHHNYQQSGNSIQQLNNTFSNCSQITFRNSRIAAALLAQQQNRPGSLINDDDVFVQGMDTKETLDETVRRLALLRLGVSVPGSNGSYPFFNSYQLASD